MKKRIYAFYDVLLFSVTCGPLMICALLIFFFGKLADLEWALKYWYLVIIFAISVGLSIGGTLLFGYCIFEYDTIYFCYFPWGKTWEQAVNNIDCRWNQDVLISEIKDIEIVKLTEEEKQTKVYYKHWFNKYLKINMKYGNPKYVYVGNYSNWQIRKIIRLANKKI